jgi:hypothetical protein
MFSQRCPLLSKYLKRKKGRPRRGKGIAKAANLEEFTHLFSPAFSVPTKIDIRRSIRTGFHMTILTGRELEVLIGLRTNWGKHYSKELARLLIGDDPKCAVDPPTPGHLPARAPMPMATSHPGRPAASNVGMSTEFAEFLDEHMQVRLPRLEGHPETVAECSCPVGGHRQHG